MFIWNIIVLSIRVFIISLRTCKFLPVVHGSLENCHSWPYHVCLRSAFYSQNFHFKWKWIAVYQLSSVWCIRLYIMDSAKYDIAHKDWQVMAYRCAVGVYREATWLFAEVSIDRVWLMISLAVCVISCAVSCLGHVNVEL